MIVPASRGPRDPHGRVTSVSLSCVFLFYFLYTCTWLVLCTQLGWLKLCCKQNCFGKNALFTIWIVIINFSRTDEKSPWNSLTVLVGKWLWSQGMLGNGRIVLLFYCAKTYYLDNLRTLSMNEYFFSFCESETQFVQRNSEPSNQHVHDWNQKKTLPITFCWMIVESQLSFSWLLLSTSECESYWNDTRTVAFITCFGCLFLWTCCCLVFRDVVVLARCFNGLAGTP